MKTRKYWKRRAKYAERKLQQHETSLITLEVRLNGRTKATYVLQAYKLEGVSGLGDYPVWAEGPGARFVIEQPVELVV